VAAAGIAIQGELADAEHLALAERLVHPPLGVVEDPQLRDLVGELVALLGPVADPDPEQDQHPRPDLRHPIALDVDRRLADPLHQRPHRANLDDQWWRRRRWCLWWCRLRTQRALPLTRFLAKPFLQARGLTIGAGVELAGGFELGGVGPGPSRPSMPVKALVGTTSSASAWARVGFELQNWVGQMSELTPFQKLTSEGSGEKTIFRSPAATG